MPPPAALQLGFAAVERAVAPYPECKWRSSAVLAIVVLAALLVPRSCLRCIGARFGSSDLSMVQAEPEVFSFNTGHLAVDPISALQ
jgi:hypothetical protein